MKGREISVARALHKRPGMQHIGAELPPVAITRVLGGASYAAKYWCNRAHGPFVEWGDAAVEAAWRSATRRSSWSDAWSQAVRQRRDHFANCTERYDASHPR